MNGLKAALVARSHEGLVEDYMKLLAEKYLLECKLEAKSALISVAEWNGSYTDMGMRSRDTVNEILGKRGS